MANFISATRSNYFRVEDPKAFSEFMSRVSGEDFDFWTHQDKDGNILFAFGGYGGIDGYIPDDEDDEDIDYDQAYDKFLEGLQKHVAEDDAVVIIHAGWEKLRYVAADVDVITKSGMRFASANSWAQATARELLHDPGWKLDI